MTKASTNKTTKRTTKKPAVVAKKAGPRQTTINFAKALPKPLVTDQGLPGTHLLSNY